MFFYETRIHLYINIRLSICHINFNDQNQHVSLVQVHMERLLKCIIFLYCGTQSYRWIWYIQFFGGCWGGVLLVFIVTKYSSSYVVTTQLSGCEGGGGGELKQL